MSSSLIEDARAVFGHPETEPFEVWSPGRVNLIGDHIDYSGGLVLPMALDRGTSAVVFPRRDTRLRGYSANFPAAGVIESDLGDTSFDADNGWFPYPMAVVDTAVKAGLRVAAGFDMYLTGSIPEGGGLSSSASVEMATAVALDHMNDLGVSPKDWAVLAQRAENAYIGVACGIMDQLAIAEGRAGMAILMDCDALECQYVPVPTERCTVVIANTNQPRQLAGSQYNERRQAVEKARAILSGALGRDVARLVDVTAGELDSCRPELESARVWPFARHTVTEQARVVAAAEALRAGDLDSFGRLMRESHESLRDDFAVTGPALDALAEAAWSTPGVIGARMTGAGFGGCTVNVVVAGQEEEVSAEVARKYREATGGDPDIFVVQPADGAGVVTPRR